jgi:hypothetical protein
MIDPLKVLICIPSYDSKVELGLAGGLSACASAHLFGNMLFMGGCSDVALARNLLAGNFLQSDMQWLVFIDADIIFSESDFRVLMDYPQSSQVAPQEGDYYNPQDTALTADGHAMIVSAEYSKKQDDLEPAQLGLGFTRIHRSVFERLQELKHENGEAIVQQFVNKGVLSHDYFIRGAIETLQWRGEDHGFFLLCKMAGIRPRIENRTKLQHVGRRLYPYVG